VDQPETGGTVKAQRAWNDKRYNKKFSSIEHKMNFFTVECACVCPCMCTFIISICSSMEAVQ
jgi:hypothetical protein